MSEASDLHGGLTAETAAELRKNWGWLLVTGICMLILGIVALADLAITTKVSMVFFGWVLVIAGIIEAVQMFRHRGAHLLLHALNAVLSIVVGLMLLRNPLQAALVITLMLAIYFTVAGIFRIVVALGTRGPGWGWGLFNGIVALILGILIWNHFPEGSLWVIGLFIGIELIVLGWTQIMTAFIARAVPVAAKA